MLDVFKIRREEKNIDMLELRRLIGKDDPVILDIGANVGQSTNELLQHMPDAKVYCFEPDPRAISGFKNFVKSTNVNLYECAVGNENGFVTFYQSSGTYGNQPGDEWDQSGSIRKPILHQVVFPSVKFEREITVPIVRLDDWAKNEGVEHIDLIWADTQGAEMDLITGGLATLRKTRYFYTEHNNLELYEGQSNLEKISDKLKEINISLSRIYPSDALFVNTVSDNIMPGLNPERNGYCPCGSRLKYRNCHSKR